LRSVLGASALAVSAAAAAQEPVRVYAAGSLRAAFTEAAAAFTAAEKLPVAFEFGPSGLLEERLERGERADLFASANMEHPQALAATGRAQPVRMFARNRLCAITHRSVGASTGNLLATMLDPATKLGTSPKADPAGDYAWELFERAERLRPGAYEALSKKALQLTGGPGAPPPPAGRNVYAVLVASGEAEVFLTYCTNALLAKREEKELVIVEIPAALEVAARYGMVVMKDAAPGGAGFAAYLLGPEGQRILERAGFAAPSQ
jgi:molybdate transport system substrate-binding protein